MSSTVVIPSSEKTSNKMRVYSIADLMRIGDRIHDPKLYLSDELIRHIENVLEHVESVGPSVNYKKRAAQARLTRPPPITYNDNWRNNLFSSTKFRPENASEEDKAFDNIRAATNRATTINSEKVITNILEILFEYFDKDENPITLTDIKSRELVENVDFTRKFRYSARFIESCLASILSLACNQRFINTTYASIINEIVKLENSFIHYLIEWINNEMSHFECPNGKRFIIGFSEEENNDKFCEEFKLKNLNRGLLSMIGELLNLQIIDWDLVNNWLHQFINIYFENQYRLMSLQLHSPTNPESKIYCENYPEKSINLKYNLDNILMSFTAFLRSAGMVYYSTTTGENNENFMKWLGFCNEILARENERRVISNQIKFEIMDILDCRTKGFIRK